MIVTAMIVAGFIMAFLVVIGFIMSFLGMTGFIVTFLVVVLQGLLILATPAFRNDRKLLAGVIAVGVTLTAIIGLGYVGGGALAVHIPLAVIVAIGASDHLRSAMRVASAA